MFLCMAMLYRSSKMLPRLKKLQRAKVQFPTELSSAEAWNLTNLPDMVEYGSATVLVFAGDEVKF